MSDGDDDFSWFGDLCEALGDLLPDLPPLLALAVVVALICVAFYLSH